MEVEIRRAKMRDVKQIHGLLNHYSEEGLLLGRSISSLYDKLRDFAVCVDTDGQIIGVCAFQITWENLAEIRSLAVAKGSHGQGIGRDLVRWCLNEADKFEITKIFALTYTPEFFRKMGFKPVNKSELPHKIWSDCINCHKFPDCDEEAVMLEVSKNGDV